VTRFGSSQGRGTLGRRSAAISLRDRPSQRRFAGRPCSQTDERQLKSTEHQAEGTLSLTWAFPIDRSWSCPTTSGPEAPRYRDGSPDDRRQARHPDLGHPLLRRADDVWMIGKEWLRDRLGALTPVQLERVGQALRVALDP
jgi:hypothetical protein